MADRFVENQAAAIVTSVLGAKCFIRRDLPERPAHDYDIRYDDERPDQPLEVTTAAKSGAIATKKRLKQGGSVLPAPGGQVWSLLPKTSFADGVDPRTKKPRTKPHPTKEMHSVVMESLRVLEAAGATAFPSSTVASADVARASWTLQRCGLICGQSRPPLLGEDPHVRYAYSTGGAGDPDLLAEALLAEAREPGNLAKLSGTAERRHLFVRVDPSSGDAYVAAQDDALPVGLPGLPPGITTLWVWAGGDHVLSITPPAAWETHAIADDVLRKPEALECVELAA